MFLANLLIYIVSFILTWFAAGLIVSATTKFSGKLKLSTFAFSFVFLGILTQAPEFSVGMQAVAHHDAEIFVGNLLGGIVVLFLVVIPTLAVFGNGISLKHELDNNLLLATMGVIIAPALFILDKKVTNLEGAILMIIYVILLFLIERKKGIFNRSNQQLLNLKVYSYKDILKIIIGLVIIFISSQLIVDKTIYFADMIKIPAFYISLIVIALGTDLPELTLAVRSVLSGKKELAMGDYIGGAAVTSFMFGFFTILHNGEVLTVSNFFVTFMFILIALSLFYFFFRTRNFVSRKNGLIMLGVYLLFVILEIAK